MSLWIMTEGTRDERVVAALALAAGVVFGLGHQLVQRLDARRAALATRK
jgi:hypothetical protein